MKRLLKAGQVADLLNIDIFSVYRFARNKTLPSIKLTDKLVRFDEDEVLKWLKDKGLKSTSRG